MNLDRLTELRKKKNWSLQYTADLLGIAKSTYAGYESGYRRPSLEALAMLADLFDTTCDDLLGRTKQKQTAPQTIELTTWSSLDIAVDGKPLSEDEIIQLITFIRTKRKIQEELS
ncbi:helix-turn-helix domain-containing protein [Bacillus mojavensis]|uniref:helix-turn-helix domain-containing protein n=1 Tax=Bacillus mojavensis TaxID=72360 RepID=UPI002DBD901A|nr:helix-turn-helix transcriptional regulator [Bacillus mojavensis]MEC1290807.1 helix-turn-helix transcriptional regulator [Bacillus mojavensis]MEC1613957.1 helix-turn-helix transcriptional regulator [Bacillus mojavensis]MEC1623689.1 helix-turn-helix transcriptional regulator [Bacillus mojavensis]MEC1633648.1 helix-turn-helix transcriptional regulator [Bacillus mojavensis]MEC1658717.1 helix-turn-helix transcriptional regulator [Bacillus mojavensis]